MFKNLRVAIVHDWLVNPGGAEKVLERIIRVFPQADLYAVCEFLSEADKALVHHKPVTTTFIQNLPSAKKHYRRYLPLMPLAIEQFDLTAYDLIISSSHAVAKGVIVSPDQVHISLCYSPIRYAWDMTHQYLNESGLTRGLKSWVTRWLLHRLRQWDSRGSNSVDEFIAISNYIAGRIEKCYRRSSTVIYPPVNTNRFPLNEVREDYYVTASRMVPYKRIDLLVRAFSRMPDRKLIVIGDGPEMARIQRLVVPNVELLGQQPEPILREKISRARAFLFAACEDFGIVPLEAQACGTPVIAYGRGGALETVVEGVTGLFFPEQTVDSIIAAVNSFEEQESRFSPGLIREHAMNFSAERFDHEFGEFVANALRLRKRSGSSIRRLNLNRTGEDLSYPSVRSAEFDTAGGANDTRLSDEVMAR